MPISRATRGRSSECLNRWRMWTSSIAWSRRTSRATASKSPRSKSVADHLGSTGHSETSSARSAWRRRRSRVASEVSEKQSKRSDRPRIRSALVAGVPPPPSWSTNRMRRRGGATAAAKAARTVARTRSISFDEVNRRTRLVYEGWRRSIASLPARASAAFSSPKLASRRWWTKVRSSTTWRHPASIARMQRSFSSP